MIEVAKYMLPIVIGYIAGKILRRRPPALIFTALVVLLVFVVAANTADKVLESVGVFLAVSILYALALVLVTGLLGSFFDAPSRVGPVGMPPISAYVSIALAAGFITGIFIKIPYVLAIDPLLLVLLFTAGVDMANVGIRLEKAVLLAPAAALLGAGIVGFLFATTLNITPAVAFGMGWYSFTGPYLANAGDKTGGAYGLLTNFLREQFTFLLGPILARRFGKVSILAIGGATTMDNTLPLYIALYGPSFSLYAFTNGVILTFIVPTLVPIVHQIYSCCR